LISGVWKHGRGTLDDIARTIRAGVKPEEISDPAFTLDMHPNPSNFTEAQIISTAAYVYTISRARRVP
jgi:hypothetical protein